MLVEIDKYKLFTSAGIKVRHKNIYYNKSENRISITGGVLRESKECSEQDIKEVANFFTSGDVFVGCTGIGKKVNSATFGFIVKEEGILEIAFFYVHKDHKEYDTLTVFVPSATERLNNEISKLN